MRQRGNLWAVVLAGGEGRRVAHLTADEAGHAVPKQFWRIRARGTMLEWALERAARLARRDRIVTVVDDRQRRFWQPLLRALPPDNVLSQPENRGTAVALLHAVVHVLDANPSATLLVLPSDHFVDDETVLERAMAGAVDAADAWPDHLVLLGARPEGCETDYGWILPGPGAEHESLPVAGFVEKPGAGEAQRLLGLGAVWNTFVLTCTGWALVHAFERALPGLFNSYVSALDRGRPGLRGARLTYSGLPRRDFGHDVLEKVTPFLRLMMLPPCGWIDLGTPERIAAWLARQRRVAQRESRVVA